MYVAKTDASTKADWNISGIGIIIRKNKTPIYTFNKKIVSDDFIEAEFIGVIETIHKALELKIRNILILTDSQMIANLSYGIGIEKLELKHTDLFAQLCEAISRHKGVRIKWISREKNYSAHNLSRKPVFKDICDERKIHNIDMIIEKDFTKKVISKDKYIMMKCVTCKDRKSSSQFPAKKHNGEKRKCFNCMGKLESIHRH